MVQFEYNCPHCKNEITSGFGDNAYCGKCDKSFETHWDYTNAEEGCMSAWLTGVEFNGKVGLNET